MGDTIGDDRQGVASGEIGVDPGRVVDGTTAVVERGGADEDAGLGPRHLGGRHAGILERFPDQLQREALLGVHLLGLAWRDRENGRVEAPDIVEHARGECVGLARLALPAVEEAARRPALVVNGADRAAALDEQSPKGRDAIGAGKPTGTSDDGDGNARQNPEPFSNDVKCRPCPPRLTRRTVNTVSTISHRKRSASLVASDPSKADQAKTRNGGKTRSL